MENNRQLKTEIIDLMNRHDIQQAEEYIRKVNRNELLKELMDMGYDKEAIDQELAALCNEGSFALDEQNLYQYEQV